jgi:hypothetical protein
MKFHFHFDKALNILWRTYLFVLLRLAVFLLAILASILWFAGVFYLFSDWPFPGPPWLAWVFGGLLWANGAKLLRNYVLYLVRAAHIAVVTRLVLHDEMPPGQTQFDFGTSIVFKNFIKVSVLFAVDRLVKVVVRAFNKSVFQFASFIPGRRSLQNFFQKVLDYSVGFVDEAILSYSLTRPETNPWSTAKDGLVLYVQNWQTILGSGFILALINYAIVGLLTLPGLIVSYFGIGALGPIAIAISAGIGLLVKFTLMDPFALVSVIVNYHHAIAGQTADPVWDRKLESVSGKFKEFSQKALNWSSKAGNAQPATPPPPPGG